MSDVDALWQKGVSKVNRPHLVLYKPRGQTLYARVGNSLASFPQLTDTDVEQMRDAFIWAAKHNALTWEILDA